MREAGRPGRGRGVTVAQAKQALAAGDGSSGAAARAVAPLMRSTATRQHGTTRHDVEAFAGLRR
jgi:hypothetical protein